MRKESNNQFSDGLISDLNPINTPNNVLTDNLNGTIITYNGNEYSLQNDMGNYKLQNCKLKPNYVPVGIKEYGDILYIVSYNPLDEHVEIGSYPAPERIFGDEGSDEKAEDQELNSLFEKAEKISIDCKINEHYYKYSELIKQSALTTFYDGDSGSLFLNPGDKFRLNGLDKLELTSVEYIKHFIVDENRRLYDVQWAIDKQNNLSADSDGFRNVGWDVPGWLAIKVELANFEEFNVNIRQVKVPVLLDKNFSVDIDLNFQLKIKDKTLMEDGTAKLKETGFIYLSIESKGKDLITGNYASSCLKWNDLTLYEIPLNDANSKFGYLNWYPEAALYHLDIPTIKTIEKLNKSDIITITAIPVIRTNNKFVIYDNFIFQQNVALNNVGSIEELNLGNSIFKFWVDKDEDDKPEYFSIEYNVDGPFTQSSSVNLYYAIWDIQNFESETRVTPYKPVEGFNGIGQNLMQIPFDQLDEVNNENKVIVIHNWYNNWIKYVNLNPNKIPNDDNTAPNYLESISVNTLNVNDKYNGREFSDRFEAESYYMVEFVFAEDINSIPNINTIKKKDYNSLTHKLFNEIGTVRFFKLILTSDVFNNLNNNSLNITANDWIEKKIDNYFNDFSLITKNNIIDSKIQVTHSKESESLQKYWTEVNELSSNAEYSVTKDVCILNNIALEKHTIKLYNSTDFDALTHFINNSPLWKYLINTYKSKLTLNNLQYTLNFNTSLLRCSDSLGYNFIFTPIWSKTNFTYYDGCFDIEPNSNLVYDLDKTETIWSKIHGVRTQCSEITINNVMEEMCRDQGKKDWIWKSQFSSKHLISVAVVEYDGCSDSWSTLAGTNDGSMYDWVQECQYRYFVGLAFMSNPNKRVVFCPVKGYTGYTTAVNTRISEIYEVISKSLSDVEYISKDAEEVKRNVLSVSSDYLVENNNKINRSCKIESDLIYNYMLRINGQQRNVNDVELICDTNIISFTTSILPKIKEYDFILNLSSGQSLLEETEFTKKLSNITTAISIIDTITNNNIEKWTNSATYNDVINGKEYIGIHSKNDNDLIQYMQSNFIDNTVKIKEDPNSFFYVGLNSAKDNWDNSKKGLVKILYCGKIIIP